jgi:hypothetical protein
VKVKKIDVTEPLKITRDGASLTLTKGKGFDAWLNGEALVGDPDAPFRVDFRVAYIRQLLLKAVDDWMHGVDG